VASSLAFTAILYDFYIISIDFRVHDAAILHSKYKVLLSYYQRIEEENKTQLSYAMRQFHWSQARWKKTNCQRNHSISILPLEYGVFTDVVNFDRFNLFLLGLKYHGMKMLYQILAGLSAFIILFAALHFFLFTK
jgi:hypothetical protein